MPQRPVLSLAELEAFDPGTRRGGEGRFCCPLASCTGKTVSKAHRCLSVNMHTGAWHCHRCGESGILQEWWTPLPVTALRTHTTRTSVRRAFGLTSATVRPVPPAVAPSRPSPPPVSLAVEQGDWRQQLSAVQPLAEAAAAYLTGRGIAPALAQQAGARFAPRWYGRPAIVFPIRDREEALVAAQGRYLESSATPKARTAGPCRDGVFSTKAGIWAADILLVTEAPLDALSLAVCGYAAIALIGTHFPAWLPRACAFKQVLIATDADPAGDAAAAKLARALAPYGAKTERLRPAVGKDWNELLQTQGAAALSQALSAVIIPRLLGR